MKKHVLLAVVLFVILGVLNVVMVLGAPPAGQEPAPAQDEEQPPDAGEGPAATESLPPVQAPEELYTSVTINPGVALPDDDPNFSCFDIPVNLDGAATLVDARVSVSQTHSWAGDLIYQLHNPDGEYLTLMNRPGHPASVFGDSSNLASAAPIAFSNAATDNAELMGNTLDTDGIICQDDGRCAYYPNPDGDGTSLASFAGLAGSAASGTWQFCASDNEGGDTGTLEEVELTVIYSLAQVEGACTIGGWEPIADVTTGRSRTGLVYSEATGKFYLLGGEATGGNRNIPIEEYDPVADTWTDKSQLLTGVSNTGAAVVEPYIYVPGGYDGLAGLDAMQRYDPVADVVTTVAAMPAANYAHAVTALDGKVYVLGGAATGSAGTTNYIYDVASNTWSSGAALPTAVQYPAATTDGTYIYVLGGNTTNLPTVQRYDPATNTWDPVPDMNVGRGGPAAFYDGHNVWAVGGGWGTYSPTTEYWDGVDWQTGPPANTGVRTLGAAYGAGMAIKAAGWDGTYSTAAEMMTLDCSTPDIEASPGAVTETLRIGRSLTRTLTISNTGSGELNWSALEAAPLRVWDFGEASEGAAAEDRGPAFADGAQAAAPEGDVSLDFPTGPVGSLTYYADRGVFDTENPGLPLEDFEDSNVLPGGAMACPAPADENSNNDCFDPGDILPGVLFQNNVTTNQDALALAGAGFNGSPTAALVSNFGVESLEIYFTAPDVYAVGVDLHTFNSPGVVDVTIYGWDGTTVLGTATAAGTQGGVFWGVTSQAPIGRITLHTAGALFEGVDNIAFGYVGVCTTLDDMPWLSVSPENGTVAAGDAQDVTLTLDATGLMDGDMLEGTLCLNSNDPDEPHVEIPLSLAVEAHELYLPAIFNE